MRCNDVAPRALVPNRAGGAGRRRRRGRGFVAESEVGEACRYRGRAYHGREADGARRDWWSGWLGTRGAEEGRDEGSVGDETHGGVVGGCGYTEMPRCGDAETQRRGDDAMGKLVTVAVAVLRALP